MPSIARVSQRVQNKNTGRASAKDNRIKTNAVIVYLIAINKPYAVR